MKYVLDCQGLNFVVAVFLIFVPEQEAFWMLMALTENPKFNFRGFLKKKNES